MIVGITRDDPYVPAVPTLARASVADPPNAIVEVPDSPVPALIVIEEFAN